MTLLEQYNQRKGAETGKPASASAQTKPTVNKPRTLLEAYQQNKAANTIQPVYSRVQPQSAPAQPGTLLEAYQQRQQQNLYTRALQRQQPQNLYAQAAENAARGIGGLLGEIYDAAEDRQSNLYSGAYAQILRRGDYAQQSGSGESRLNLGGDTDRRYDYINDINGYRARVDEDAMLIGDTQRMGKYAFMTKDEVGVYNYLYATQGRNAADSYLDELEPELDKQWYSGMRASTLEDAMQSSADKAWYSAMSVLQQPIRSVNSAMQNLEDALDTAQGREINPYSELRQASRLTQDVRGEIAGQMSDVGSFAYQTAMSAGDSAVNAIIAKGLGGLTGATGDALMKATNLIGSLTMSSEVMSLAVAENKEKGYSDAGALALGLIRGAVEYASEAMGGEWVIKNVKKNPMNFVKTMVLNMIPEGVEEVMSDAMNGAVNLLVDQIFGTEESGWPKLINDFKANGTEWQKKNPELAAMLAILGEEGLSFLGGAFATFGSSGVQYTTNRASISRTAQQLHTTAESVAQLMETYDAESAGQIEALAQIFDADSVEDFTRKMADNRTAEAALDTIMRGQENENAAPEGTADMEGVFSNGEQGYDRGSENRDAAVGTGGEGIDNEGRARALRMDAGNEGGQRSDRFQDLVREEVTPASLGVANGSAGQTVQVLDENRFEAGSPEAQAARRARQNGLEPVFIKGTMQVGEGENAKQARAYIVGNRVMLQADGNVNADQLLNHELYHQAAQRDPRLNEMIRSALAENMTEAELGALVDRYIQAYDGVYDFSSMTAEQIAAICEEEIFADLYAGIDNTGRQELRDTTQSAYAEAQTMQPQNVEAERDTRGPPEGRASYAGQNARTADSNTLRQAEQMEQEGRSSEEIRRETGWFKGRDGQWRFEIDDSGARYYRSGDARFRNDHPEYARYQELMGQFLNGNLSAEELLELQELEQTWGREQNRLKGLVDSGHATLDMLLDHPALYEAYPELREARIRFADMETGARGAYNSRTNSFTLSNELRSAPESTLIHEIQHAIQAAEGFSGGSSVEYWENQERSGRVEGWKSEKTKALEKEYTDLMESLPEETRQLIREANQAYADGDFERIDALEDQLSESPYGNQYFDLMALEGRIGNARDADRKTSAQANYMNTAGEIEARDAANRRIMTDEDRKNTPPDLGDENTVFAESQSAVSFEKRADLDSLDIPWDSDNTSTIKEQVVRNLDKLNSLEPVTTVDYDKNTQKQYYEQLDGILKSRFGYRIDRQGFGSFLFDKNAVNTLRHYVGSDAEAAAAIASPYVLKRGEIISGHRNHNNGQYPSVTFAAPVVLNGEKGIEAVTVLFADKDRVHSLRVLAPDGTEFVLMPIKNETGLEMAGVNAKAKITQPTSAVSDNSIRSSSENSNPQNGGRASVEVGGEGQTLDELRREYRERTEAYTRANEANDPDYDYAGEIRRINELERMMAAAGENTQTRTEVDDTSSATRRGDPSAALGMTDKAPGKTQNMYDEHPERGPIGKDGLRTCKDVDAMRDEINEIGGARLKNNAGSFKVEVRRKGDGHYLCTIDRNGKRDVARTFGVAEEAAEWAAGYVDAQSRAREDAELDRHKSEQKPEPTITEQLFGQTNPRQEAKRRKSNSAADAATQTLRERIRRANDEIQALNRLEKTTGLTEQQKAHRADLQETLEIMNDELTSRKSKRGEKQDSDRVEVTGNKPTQSVAAARREIMDQFHIPAGMRKEAGDAIQQRLDEMLQAGRVTEESRQALFNTLMDAGVVPKQAEPTFRQIREDLSGRRIYVSDKERADFGDNWKGLYQRAWGDRIFLTSDPSDMKIDAVNRELADVYGENRFPTDASLTDMLDNMLDLAAKGRTTQQGIREAVADEAHYSGVSADQIYSEMFSDMDARLRSFAKEAGLEVALKDKAASDMASERKRWEDRMERQAQRRRESKVREKVLKGLQRLEKLRGKAAPDVRTQVDEVLKDIDTQARSITPYGLENLQALQTAYEEKAKQEGFIDDENPGNFLRNPYVEEKLARLSKMHLDEMDIGDVIELGRVVSSLENTIRTANQMIGEEFDATIKETAEGVDKEVKAAKGAKPGFFQKWFREEQLSPRRFLEMLGGWKDGKMRQLARSLEDGQTRMLDFQRRAAQSFDDFMSKEENRKWLETASGKKAKWSTYGVVNGMAMDGGGYTGQSIEITPMMKIALYLHSLNEDNLRHIQTGGLVIPNKALYQKGKIQEAYAQGEHVKMQPEAVRAIASTLTQQEKTFAGYLQKFFNQQSKEAINEVSMQLDGFERAGVDNYFPIESSRSYLASDVAGEARAQTVEGIGSIANERVHAGNPIVLSDASDVLMRQIDKVSRYYGFAIPIRNFQAVNNYVFHEEGNAFAGSIKDTINRKWGAGAENYITKMLADLQSGGKRSDMMGSALAKLRGNLAGATLMVNPSVAVSQVASYTGAAQVVGWDGLAAGLAGGRVDPKLIEKYTPLYWYRNQGNSTQELGDAIKDKGLEQKLPWAMNWIQKMDSATIRRLWAAAEYRVKKDNPNLKPGSRAQIDAGTDAYYKKVAEVFNRAVYDTQPNYTNMERAQILRSDSDLTKFLTMYKTVPLQYYGMMTEAVGRLRAAMQGGTESEKAAARKYAADTFAGLMMANSVYVAVKALFKGLRKKDDDYRDEEGNLTAGSAGKQLGKDLAEVYAGSVIGGAEAYSALQALMSGKKWHGPEMSALTHVEDIVNGVGKIYTAIDDDDPRAAAGAAKAAALNVAMAFGFPAKNVETYLMAMIRWAKPEWGMEYDNLFGGISKSDLSGMDTEAAGTAVNIIMRNRTGVSFGRETTDELARLYGEGFRDAVPAAVPEYYTVNGERVEITDRAAYGEAWGGIVGDQLEELMTSDDYRQADDKTRKAMLDRLYDYATVQARKACDPGYSVTGNSTYGWTDKADAWLNAGVSLSSVISMMMSNGEASSFAITDQAAYSEAWNSVVNDGLKPLISSADYRGADDDTQNSMVNRLYQYATVQARLSNDPGYDVSNSSTYSWTLKADMCADAGISLPDTIRYMTAIGNFTADKDENGKSISGSKKEKVVAYIDGLDLTDEQKDLLYVQFGGYKENTLASTPWHDGSSGGSSGRRGSRGGGRRSRRGSSRTSVHRITSGKTRSSVGSGIDISELFGGSGSGKKQNSADASGKLLEIVNRYYGGDEWAAAMDGGRKVRSKVDFKL